MENSPSELPQEKTSVESCSSESSSHRPVLSQINYECSDDSPAAAKLSGAANAGYNVKNYAGNKAAKVVDEKFSLTSVYSKPYLTNEFEEKFEVSMYRFVCLLLLSTP